MFIGHAFYSPLRGMKSDTVASRSRARFRYLCVVLTLE
jgi:hypothetical protein